MDKHDLYKQCAVLKNMQANLNKLISGAYTVALRVSERTDETVHIGAALTVFIYCLKGSMQSLAAIAKVLVVIAEEVEGNLLLDLDVGHPDDSPSTPVAPVALLPKCSDTLAG